MDMNSELLVQAEEEAGFALTSGFTENVASHALSSIAASLLYIAEFLREYADLLAANKEENDE